MSQPSETLTEHADDLGWDHEAQLNLVLAFLDTYLSEPDHIRFAAFLQARHDIENGYEGAP